MKKLIIKKLELQTEAKQLVLFWGVDKIGTVMCDGGFIPARDFEFSPALLRQILFIQENFWMFWENVK